MAETVLQDVYTLQIRRQNSVSNPSPYCEACKNGFVHVNSIQVRQFTQTGKLPGVCRSCNEAFLKICRLQIRHLTQTSTVHHTCPKCNKAFSHAGNFKKHMVMHEKEEDPNHVQKTPASSKVKIPLPPYECKDCGRVFVKHGCFLKHVSSHIKAESDAVEATNNVEEKVETDNNEINVPKQYVCAQCDMVFTKKGFLLQHIQSQHETELFECSICKKSFETKPLLSSHMRAHKHICKLCKEVFSDPECLETHLQNHVNEQVKVVQSKKQKLAHNCSVCQRVYFHLGHLRKHYLTHTNDSFADTQPFVPVKNPDPPKQAKLRGKPRYSVCEICNKRFKFARTYKKHLLSHKDQAVISLPSSDSPA